MRQQFFTWTVGRIYRTLKVLSLTSAPGTTLEQ